MPDTPHPMVIAGYDGSPASLAAVERGVKRVGSTGHLVVVVAHHVAPDHVGASYYQSMLDDSLSAANDMVAELIASCEGLGAVSWEHDLVQGPAGPVIASVAETREADEIVIGTRGRGRFGSLLGSVATDVLHRAACPVVVIPQRMVEADSAESRRTAAHA
jgi:nucleotide-binding universal stress UspA family protein